VAPPVSEQQGNAIALRGSFNPQILQPAWLAAQGLIRDAESESAEIGIVHSEVVAFELEWMQLEVDREQLTVMSTAKSETPEQIRDLALGIIQILDHTPIHHVGIRFYAHYSLADQAERDKLGWTLVPPGPFEAHLHSAGMRTLSMAGRRSADDTGGDGLVITIEPSARIRPNGVFIDVVDQYELAAPDEANIGAGPAIECLKANWNASIERAAAIPTDIFSLI
jgi:hypothetical protein